MRIRTLVGLLFAALFLFPIAAHAQSTATLSGTVTDSSGAAVPGASVKVVDTKTNTTYFGKTSGDGTYRITEIAPGPGYSLTITKDGFEVFVVNNLYLPVGVPTLRDAELKIGSVGQSVVVTSEGAVTLNTLDTTVGNNIDIHAISTLPNEFRDDPSNLLRLEVGVVSAITPPGGPTSGTGAIDPNLTRDGAVAGARTDQNNIFVDGIVATNVSSGFAFETEAAIPVEAVQEFATIVSNPTPIYGGGSGAQTFITTKSGTNDFHGSAYEFNRTAATEADTFFNNQADVPRTALIRNQFGANVGGPIWKNKAFFFFEYDGRRDDESASVLDIVPMPHVKLGELAYVNNSGGGSCSPESRLTSADVSTSCVTILSAAQVAALDPCSTMNCSGTPGFQAAGVDPTLISLFSSRYPNPNDYSQGDGINTAGFRFNAPTPLIENEYLARGDLNITNTNKLFVRFNFRNETSTLVPIAFPGDPETSPDIIMDRAWVLGDTWVLGPNLVNKFTYGETRQNEDQPILFNPGGGLYELSFGFGGLSNPFLRQTSFSTLAPTPTFRDDMTWTHGRNTFNFGGEWEPILIEDGLTNDFAFVQEGLGGNIPNLDPSLRPTDILNNPVSLANWDSAFVGSLGSLFDLQALINYTGKGVPLPTGSAVKHDYKFNQFGGYFLDTVRLKPTLVMTLGVRYQYQTVPYETHGVEASYFNTDFRSIIEDRVENGLEGLDAPSPELTYQLAGKVNHAPPLYNPEKHDFSPRLGFVWNPGFDHGFLSKMLGDRKTVFRTSAALIYDQTVINNIVQLQNQGDYTFGGSFAEEFGTGGDTASQNLTQEPRFNSITTSPVPVVPPPFVTPITPSAVFNYDLDNQFHTPYAITPFLGMQRDLGHGFQLEIDYQGRFSRRLFVLADAGQLVNYTDPASGQTLSQAFANMEKAAEAGAATVAPQPFLEDIDGPGATAAIYANNQSGLALGNTAGVAFGNLPPNVGFATQFIVNALGTNLGNASYNAMFTSLRKSLTHNLQFDFDYTYSHSIDNNSTIPHANGNFEPGVTTILCDATNAHVCRGNSEFDATNQITGYFVYDLPFGHGQRWGRDVSKVVNEAIGGWEVSGIETWRTGLALTADSGVASTTSLAADAGEVFVGPRSALASSIHIDAADNNQVQFFKNPAAAAAAFTPDLGIQVGTRDNLRGPHFSNMDVAVLKNFPLVGERYRLQFRADAYNVFNHTNFGLYDPTLTAPTFGQLTSEAGLEPSRVMQFALRFDF